MKRSNSVALLVAFLAGTACVVFMHCSMPTQISGGGSDTEITGKIVDQNGNPALNTLVRLIPYAFNPVQGAIALDSLPADTTDSTGTYRFPSIDTGGIYTIEAVHSVGRTRSLCTGIKALGSKTNVPTCALSSPGSIRFIVRDTVDTTAGYIYIKGTSVSRNLSGALSIGGSYYAGVRDSAPPGDMPPIILVSGIPSNAPVVLANTVIVTPFDTARVSVTTKPLWHFSLVVAVDKGVSDYYGGLNSVIPRIQSQVRAASKAFNDTSAFNGIIDFGVDSFYVYTTDLFDEMVKPLGSFDYRLLYDNATDGTGRDFGKRDELIKRYSNIYLQDNASVLFTQTYTGILTALLGELRGCLHLTECGVDSAKNSVNKTGYYGVPSYMNISYNPVYGSNVWDAYNVHIANYNADNVGNERNVIYKAFPAKTGISVRSNTGTPVAGAGIRVYGSMLDSDSLTSKPLFQGVTDTAGLWLFTGNPFKPDTGNTIKYGNLLISAVAGSDTAFAWLPLFEAGTAYFIDQNMTLFKEITF